MAADMDIDFGNNTESRAEAVAVADVSLRSIHL